MSDDAGRDREREKALRALIAVIEDRQGFLTIVAASPGREECVREISRHFNIEPQHARIALGSTIEQLFAAYRVSGIRDELADLANPSSQHPDGS